MIRVWWSEHHRKDGEMAEAELAFTDGFNGSKVSEAQDNIVEQYSAPYFEPKSTGHTGVADMGLPEDYDQEDWEESIETAVEAAQELQEYHDALHEATEPYLK